jgi:phosphatidate cytidylyltransferase
MPSIPWGAGILFFLVAGIAGQVGDLFESEMKRSSDIKDSGSLLPGHGGFLDRIDALLFASPVAYLFKVYIF